MLCKIKNMKVFIKSHQKHVQSIFISLLFSLLLTGCPGSIGGPKTEPEPQPKPIDNPDPDPDSDPTPVELDFKTETVGMSYCTLTWNWNDTAHDYQRISYSPTEDFSSNVKEKKNFNKDSLPVVLDSLTSGNDYYIKLEYYDLKTQENKTALLKIHTNDKGPLDNLKIKYDNDSKAVKISYDYIRDSSKIKFLKVYRKLKKESDFALIKEGSANDFLDNIVDYEYAPNVENFYKIELYDADGKNLGAQAASELSIIPEDEEDALDIKVVKRGYSYLDLLWDYSLYDSYKIIHKGTGVCDPIEYTSADLTTGKSIHFYFPKNKERAGIIQSISFTIECYKNDVLQKTVKRTFEILNTGAPESLTTQLTNSNIKLQWNSFDKANDVIAKVYRRTDTSSDYEFIGSQKYWFELYTDEFAAYEDTSYVAGTTNYYKVELYAADKTECGELFGSAEVSCDASSKCSITFDLGEKRKSSVQYVKAYFDKNTDLSTCNDGTPFDDTPSVAVSTDYSDLYEATDTWLYENAVFNFDITLSQNIVLQALYRPKPTFFTNYLSEDTKLYLNWKEKENWNYKLEYGKKDGPLTTVDCGKNTSKILENLDAGQTYTVNLYTVDSENVSSNPVTKEIVAGPQETEFLLIMYLDGDNNLNNPIYLDMNEVEYGLSKLESTDHIRVIALWDGFVGDSENPAENMWGTPGTHIYELGKDVRVPDNPLAFLELSANTFDWSYTADWLSGGEVDMGSKDTLQNYLKWVKDHFSGTKTILQFSNHGGGPRSLLPNDDRYGRRAMCWDTNDGGTGFLKTKDVSDVLDSVELKNGSKIELIIEDVCLGSTIEEAYQYKDAAQYFIASPNTVPGLGLDYDMLIPSMKQNATINSIGDGIVRQYKESFAISNMDWMKILAQYKANYGVNAFDEKSISLFYPGACGLSFVDLEKLAGEDGVVAKLDKLAQGLCDLQGKTIDKTITLNGQTVTLNGDFLTIMRDYLVCPGNPIFYQGFYTWLYDIGAILDALDNLFYNNYSLCQWLNTNVPTIPIGDWQRIAREIMTPLSQAIVCSWRDGYTKPSYDSTVGWNEAWLGNTINHNYYGLSICGGTVTENIEDQEYPSFYETDLQFAQACPNWNNLLKLWFQTETNP